MRIQPFKYHCGDLRSLYLMKFSSISNASMHHWSFLRIYVHCTAMTDIFWSFIKFRIFWDAKTLFWLWLYLLRDWTELPMYNELVLSRRCCIDLAILRFFSVINHICKYSTVEYIGFEIEWSFILTLYTYDTSMYLIHVCTKQFRYFPYY